jgi:histidinol dehydrogenase
MPLKIMSYEQYQRTHSSTSINDYVDQYREVQEIIAEVRNNGDAALKGYALQFDQARLDNILVSGEEIDAAIRSIKPELVTAIRGAKDNIEKFHLNQLENDWWETKPGWLVGQRIIPLQRIGAYIPGGTAAYPSSVLMTVIPARVAGVKEIYITTPPDSEGRVNPLTLLAAREAGATAVFKAGGAQAVAALAYGTETIPAVQKIVGPGNIYVTLAKKEVYGQVGIDMLAGPSEIVIVALDDAHPSYVAADLLSQAEHDPLSRSILITTSENLARQVNDHLREQLTTLPRREVAESSLSRQGAIIIIKALDEAWPIVNELAPEHLELQFDKSWRHLDKITSAGAVFIGSYSPEPLGDYWAGSNHVLPTGSSARYASALGVADFIKKSHVLFYEAGALDKAAPHVVALARAEGLEAHARAILVRGLKENETLQHN